LCNCYNQYYSCNTLYHMVQHWIHNIYIYSWTLVKVLGLSFDKKFIFYWVLGNDFFQHGTIKFGWKILNIMSIWSNQMALGQHLCTRCVANICYWLAKSIDWSRRFAINNLAHCTILIFMFMDGTWKTIIQTSWLQYFIMSKAQILGMGGIVLKLLPVYIKKNLNVVQDYRSTFTILA